MHSIPNVLTISGHLKKSESASSGNSTLLQTGGPSSEFIYNIYRERRETNAKVTNHPIGFTQANPQLTISRFWSGTRTYLIGVG